MNSQRWIVVPLALCCVSPAFGGQSQGPRNFTLTFRTDYGLTISYQSCEVRLVFYNNRGSASLRCFSPGVGTRPERSASAAEDLSAREVARITDLFGRSLLYESGHTGTDSTAVDGVFETLRVDENGRTVVVVTSGNPTFVQDPVRKELLSVLSVIQYRLRGDAAQK